jgi:hypothetical protein
MARSGAPQERNLLPVPHLARRAGRPAPAAVTEDYKLDRKQSIAILNEALATEIVCVLRYSFH